MTPIFRHPLGVVSVLALALGAGLDAAATSAQAQASGKRTAPAGAAKPAVPPGAVGAEPNLIGQYGGWGAYVAAPGGRKVCFVLAKPSSSKTNPANRPRDAAYAFVSTRPDEKVRDEVSIMIGYSFKPGYEATLEVAGTKFALYTQGDGAWIKNAAEETRLVDALRKGSDVVIRGLSARGTETTDVFPLKGLAQALDRASQDCR